MPSELPKVAHMYWGRNVPMSCVRAATVYSFLQCNPEWSVKLWTPERPVTDRRWLSGEQAYRKSRVDWFPRVSVYPRVAVQVVNGQYSGGISEVHRSDIFRWEVLEREGGLWSDMDILYFAPVSKLFVNNGWSVALCRYKHIGLKATREWFPIGFLASKPRTGFFAAVHQQALRMADPNSYQSCGHRCVAAIDAPQDTLWIPQNLLYFCAPRVIKMLHGHAGIPDGMMGLHWYGGDRLVGNLLYKINEPGDVSGLPVTAFSNRLKEVLHEI